MNIASLVRSISTVPRPVVLIDGRSGSGKSSLADELAPALGAQLVRLDDIYPGWDGLQTGSDHVHEFVLTSHPRWQAWDWDTDSPGEWRELDASAPLVIEGAGTLSAANRRLATYGIWIEMDATTRKQRALARDGDLYAPHWERWAAQEEAFAASGHPRGRADIELVG